MAKIKQQEMPNFGVKYVRMVLLWMATDGFLKEWDDFPSCVDP